MLGGFLVPDGPLGIDMRWSELMRDAEATWLTHLALVFNALGHGILRGLTIAGVGLVLLVAGRRAALLAFALAEALTPLLVNLTKLLVGRERPPGAMIEAHGSSYPSGHAAYAGATAVLLVLLFTTRADCDEPDGPWPSSRRPGWSGVEPTCRCTGCRTQLREPRSASASPCSAVAAVQIALDAAGPCERLRRDRAAIQVTAAVVAGLSGAWLRRSVDAR